MAWGSGGISRRRHRISEGEKELHVQFCQKTKLPRFSKAKISQILNCTKKSPNMKVVPFDLLYNFVNWTNSQFLLHFEIHFWE
jgi:hypothetical protein